MVFSGLKGLNVRLFIYKLTDLEKDLDVEVADTGDGTVRPPPTPVSRAGLAAESYHPAAHTLRQWFRSARPQAAFPSSWPQWTGVDHLWPRAGPSAPSPSLQAPTW